MPEERDDVETAWARIVADYDRVVDDPVARWPVAEDLADPSADASADASSEASPDLSSHDRRDTADTGAAPRTFPDLDLDAVMAQPPSPGADLEPDDRDTDHHYVPPEPPPLALPDLPHGIAWAGVLGGPVLLLLATVLTWHLPGLLTAGCVVGFVGGLVFLVAGMDDGSGRDGWDDGAQV